MTQRLYSVGTWSTWRQAYTPQVGCSIYPQWNITHRQLRTVVRELRKMGYSAHRRRDSDGYHDDNDWSVLIERTDGEQIGDIRRSFRR